MPRNTMTSQATAIQDIDRASHVSNVRTERQSRPASPTPEAPRTPTNHNNRDDSPGHTPGNNPFSDHSVPDLAQAIMMMTQELRRRETAPKASKTKVKEPDTFDGSDPRKLSNFILLCNLFFRNNSAYSEDDAKVTFALSHLRGTALEYFEPAILAEEYPDWFDDWSAFVRTLRTQFGPIDPTADAEDNINNLKMRDNQRILKYNVEFNRLAVQTGWDDSVLHHRYYSGLAERIKDVMGQQGKPTSLSEMKTLAHTIDARHWERLREKSRTMDKSSTTNKNDNKHDKKPNHQPLSSLSSNNNNNNNSSNKSSTPQKNQSKDSANKPAASSNPLADKLGKDSKLTLQERQHRFDLNLCMFCGRVGHTAKDCSKATSSAFKAKGRATQAKAEEPKK